MTDRTDAPAEPPLQPTDFQHVSLLWAVQQHAAEIAALHARLFPSAWDEASITRLLNHPGAVALVASYGKPAVIGGYAMAQIAVDEAEILSLGVTEGWQRHGIGTRLVDGLKRAASRGGARAVFLEVAESNAVARKLYERAGFRVTARRKSYYRLPGGDSQDAVVMRCELDDQGA